MRYPKFLNKNSTIGVFAPSLSCPSNPYLIRYQEAKKKLGYKFYETKSLYNEFVKARSADKEIRAKEFKELYFNDSVDFIWAVAGGEFMMEILPYIDFDAIKNATPKFYMGYSDNTNLTFLLTTICDVASIYGYHPGEFGVTEYDKSLTQTLKMLNGESLYQESMDKYQTEDLKHTPGLELSPFNCQEKVEWKTLSNKDETIKGRIIGGCLDVLQCLCGTRFDKVKEFVEKYKDDGIIWYLESCDLNILSQGRAFFQLKEAGWFKYCKGIVLGRPINKNDNFGVTYEDILNDFLSYLNVPVIYDVDIGHMAPSCYIINGSITTIECKNNKGKIITELK